MKTKAFILLVATSLFADEANEAQNGQITSVNSNTEQNTTRSQSGVDLTPTYELPPTVISAPNPVIKYFSGSSLDENALNSAPNGNGDITSALKVLPNVQFDNAQLSSNTPGEIDPANISISGGLFYQNNFQLDGFNMNNDLDPASNASGSLGGGTQGLSAQRLRGGQRSQGFNIDTSLLESIVVLDSNIGAAYGGFTGGVVEANVRNPRRDGWHFDISYQHTSDKLTQYHIDEQFEENLANSADEKFQPKFSKHLIKASIEGWANDKFGIIGAFSTTRSYIPLIGYTSANQYFNPTQAFDTRKQKRISDNYYLKAIYNATSDFSLEANLGFMPQFNTYFNPIAKDSFYTMQTGGYQAGLKGLWETGLGLWTNQLGYSLLQNSRQSDKNYFLVWRHSALDKNWAATRIGFSMEGGVSSVEQMQHSLSYKSDMNFDLAEFLKIRVGAEFDYQYVNRKILDDTYYSGSVKGEGYTSDLKGAPCTGVDLFGVPLCSTATTTATTAANNNVVLNGQYIKSLNVIKKSLTKLDVLSYAFYVEEDIRLFDYTKIGEMNARLGLRVDGDSYMDKGTAAPRLSLSYIAPWRGGGFNTRLSFGANRYYGRNLFSYRLYDSILSATKNLTRADINSPWIESDVSAKSQFKFNRLDIPYSDEVMVGLSQDIGAVNFNAKYINRQGKDEIIQRGSSSKGYYYTNEGSSKSDIITASIENTEPFKTLNVYHHFLFAFDYTAVNRAYNPFAADETYIDDPDILYDGKIIKYSERPTENFALPWTLRLSTTQTMKLGFTRLLWNNFFRYRSGYDRMVSLTKTSPNWNAQIGDKMSQYGKYHFKGAFTWDMRLGLEFMLGKAGTFYTNVDIINVLNLKNETTISNAYGNMLTGTILGASAASPVYDVGRQFWLQFGYKY